LTVLGRRDSQVKVRGNRISLGELEGTIAAVPGVTGAVVCASSSDGGHSRLTAYLTKRAEAALTTGDVVAALRDTLPQREMPTAFVFVDGFPMTSLGKVDRARLALSAIAPERGTPAPLTTDTERRVAAIWAEALEVEVVGADDDFFALEGDSLTAAAIAAGLYAEFGVEVELRAFLECGNVAAMARHVDRLRADAPADARPALMGAPRLSVLPMSYAQERVWRSAQTPEGALDQNMRIAVGLHGDLDAEALRASLDRLVARHDILRTTYTRTPDARLEQQAQAHEPFALPLEDLSAEPDPQAAAHEELRRMAQMPFDLERDWPMKLKLLRLAPREHWLAGTVHHIAIDAHSWQVIFDELRANYEAPAAEADEPAYQYGDFAVWERRNLNPRTPRYKRELAFWADALRNADQRPLELPCHWASPPAEPLDRSEGVVRWGFDPDVSRRLDDLGRDARATAYMTRLALFAAQAAIETGRDELAIGAYMTNRRLVELQSMVGDFTNLTTLVLSAPPSRTFRAWVEHVRDVVEDTSAHSEIAYEELKEMLRRRRVAMPYISTVFGLDPDMPGRRLGAVELTFVPTMRQMAPNGLSFFSSAAPEDDRCEIFFDVRTYDPARVRAFAERHRDLARRATADPDSPLGAQAPQTQTLS
jgi:acyl carrier protein